MADLNGKLPPIMRERLAKIGEESPEEKERREGFEKLDSLLAEFYRDSLDSKGLFRKLKEYEGQGKQFLLKEAKIRLGSSFKRKGLPIKFRERSDGKLALEFKEKEICEESEPVLELNSSNFDEEVKKHPLLVVDCWAPWCAPCRMVTPVIEELARDYQGKITFGKLNVDSNQSVAMKYGIRSIPTLLIFKNGQLVDQKIGALPRKMLEPELIKHLEESKGAA